MFNPNDLKKGSYLIHPKFGNRMFQGGERDSKSCWGSSILSGVAIGGEGEEKYGNTAEYE